MREASVAIRDARNGAGGNWNKTVRRGIMEHMRNRGMIVLAEEHVSHAEEPNIEPEECEFWASVAGVLLRPELVRKAREDEMEEFRKHRVYVNVPEAECREKDRQGTDRDEVGGDNTKGMRRSPSIDPGSWQRK